VRHPQASRAIVTRCETGAVTVPDVSGNGRYTNQYTAAANSSSTIAIAMLT